MESLAHYPFFVLVFTFVFLSIATMAGASLHRRYPTVTADHKEDLGVILAATLTLLALIIGFSFAMATNRYDERKRLEEAEASATRTEIVRAELLQPAEAAKVRNLLGEYLISAYCFMASRTFRDGRRWLSALANWRPISGPPFAKLRRASQRLWSPS